MFGAAALLVVGFAAPAWAHVTISPSEAPKGSDAVLTFVVPNEMDNATTTQILVQFPHDHPIAAALVSPVAGWTATVKMFHTSTAIQTDSGPVNDAVDTVTWKANAGTTGIAVGGFQQFPVSVGLPNADSLTFPALQTYSNSKVVSWVQVTPPGGPEPDNPAPVLTLTAGESSATTPTTVATDGSAVASSKLATKSDVDSAKTVSIIALIVGIIGVILAIVALVLRTRKGSTPSA
jgi:uncharacterized protein YcnI